VKADPRKFYSSKISSLTVIGLLSQDTLYCCQLVKVMFNCWISCRPSA